MTRCQPLVPLALAVVLGSIIVALPGRAQQTAPQSRFVFADTTLLRDTLDLTFGDLFELADSLGVMPDSLRAFSIRHRLPLRRLLVLADSLRVPVDSVGPVLQRERYNPLAAARGNIQVFTYTTSYTIQQTTSTWTNLADYNLVRGGLFVRNTTDIAMDRYHAGGQISLRQTRASRTEAGWKLSPMLSVGGRVGLERFASLTPGAFGDEGETKNEYQLSMRSRQQPSPWLTSTANFFSGLLDVTNSTLEKRGITADLNGSMRYVRGSWLSYDINGQLSGNLARTRVPGTVNRFNTNDQSGNVRGSLALYSNAPVSLNVNHNMRRVRVETPADSTTIETLRTDDDGMTATLRMRQTNTRYLNVTQNFARSRRTAAQRASNESTRRDDGVNINLVYDWLGWSLDGRLSNAHATSEFPRRDANGGYIEDADTRSVDGVLNRLLTRTLTFRAAAGVSLGSYRYGAIGTPQSIPVARDLYRQNWRADVRYNRSQNLSTGVGVEVIRSLNVNLPSASTAANSEIRNYRANWNWSLRMLEGLTVNQVNTLSADYVFYTFLPTSNRLTMDFSALTTFNAVVTPRFRFDVTHNARFQPSGNYGPLFEDGVSYFSKADEGTTYRLAATMVYSPAAPISLTLQTDYLTSERVGTTNGLSVLQRVNRNLNFSGGASLNVPVGLGARLVGDIRRTYRGSRNIAYAQGEPQLSPRSESDYWVGRLDLTWNP